MRVPTAAGLQLLACQRASGLACQWASPPGPIPLIKMGDGEAPVAQEPRYLGSMLSKHLDDSVTIMARIRLARIALTKLRKAIFGTRRVALESKKIAYESLVLSLLLYGSECWVVKC
jgi:hypothetical protein